ncbi:MAG: amidohydrolase, partial [Candidatus Hydrogenedentes bacterium]|nr:amidohydrolase [Candidatus Hydrogenedentota bacterium]
MNEVIDAYCTPGTERDTRLTPAELIRWMDEAGIGRAVVAPEDREIAVNNTAGNTRILEMARHAQGRFIPACTVNPWLGGAGCRELRR